MRKKIVAGNWKMNLDYGQAKSLLQTLIQQKDDYEKDVELIICPTPIYASVFAELLNDHKWLHLGSQNCYHTNEGAFTGEISPSQLKSLEVGYCLVGHSERRDSFNESYEFLTKKVDALLKTGITPIFCCGEQIQVRESNVYKEFVMKQIEDSLFHLKPEEFEKVIIAYEPIWAIGTGKTATSEEAQEIHALIRARIAKHYGDKVAGNTSIIYGGSCKPENAKELFSQKDIDGGLIGGASLDAASFMEISKSF